MTISTKHRGFKFKGTGFQFYKFSLKFFSFTSLLKLGLISILVKVLQDTKSTYWNCLGKIRWMGVQIYVFKCEWQLHLSVKYMHYVSHIIVTKITNLKKTVAITVCIKCHYLWCHHVSCYQCHI